MLSKPADMFDRDFEWAALTRFMSSSGGGARLGVVSGRRRQGKTYLLRALCEAAGGFYFSAEETAAAVALRRIGAAIAAHDGARAPYEYTDWHPVVDALLALGRERPVPVVIDEFPYLVKAVPSLPSIIQNALAPRRPERDQSSVRLLLCGSAMSFMGKLLSGHAPLRGRAGLEMVVHTLDHQLAAQFWGLSDPSLALRVNAVVGGTPAYRREFVDGDVPDGSEDFDSWVVRTVLSPASPLFREARHLLVEELDLRDPTLYHMVLAAIADGNATRGGIASYLGRKSGDLAHPLMILEDSGLIARETDAFRENRATFKILDPLLSFYHAIMEPRWSDWERGRDATRMWRESQRRFDSNILGPHFENVCRNWTRHFAEPELFGDYPNQVRSGTVNDPTAKTSHELDLVVRGLTDDNQKPILAIGEAKWGETMGMSHVRRLRHIRGLLTAQGRLGAAEAKLACYSGVGFTEELQREADQSPDIRLIGLDALYR